MELSNQHYLGNDQANPFYYIPEPLGYIDGKPIYEGASIFIACLNTPEEKKDWEESEEEDIPW